jgi:hypothetical protein
MRLQLQDTSFGESLKIGYRAGECQGLFDEQIHTYRLAFAVSDKPNYVMWRYNSFVQACTDLPLSGGGGNRLTQGLLQKFHQKIGQ